MKPRLPKGTRDFLPDETRKRNYIFDTIREVFRIYGYHPIETPAMEALETLTGRYGDEGDKLLFRVLNNGDFLAEVDDKILQDKDSNAILPYIAKRGLRYDLTVPFARYIVMNRHAIKLPFKRSAIQPVWRADRPQRGRYQEFYQCDADIAGSDSLYSEAELVKLYDEVFRRLNLPVVIRINSRKILQGIIQSCGMGERFSEVANIIDKLDKISDEKGKELLIEKGFDKSDVNRLFDLIHNTQLDSLKTTGVNALTQEGISDLETICSLCQSTGLTNQLIFDPSLARGLSYYTGAIFEVTALDANMGSIGGGGRYDNLTDSFGMPDIPGVGISFGAERIYDLMEEKHLFPPEVIKKSGVLILCMDAIAMETGFNLTSSLRNNHISTELYPEPGKMNKMMSYANDNGYSHVIIIGSDEVTSGLFTVKNMHSGKQQKLTSDELLNQLA